MIVNTILKGRVLFQILYLEGIYCVPSFLFLLKFFPREIPKVVNANPQATTAFQLNVVQNVLNNSTISSNRNITSPKISIIPPNIKLLKITQIFLFMYTLLLLFGYFILSTIGYYVYYSIIPCFFQIFRILLFYFPNYVIIFL